MTETVVFSEANELESISTGLTDLIIKVREFNEGRSVKRHLLPPAALQSGSLILDGFQVTNSRDEKEIYHFAPIEENLVFAFLMRTDLTGIEASLTLSMARMAVRLITEELNVHSAYHCIKDLEEYFRINLRRKLNGDFIAILINHAENKLFYAGCGKIKLVTIDSSSGKFSTLLLPDCEPGSSKFHEYGNQETPFTPGMIAFAVSPVFSDICCRRLPELVPVIISRSQAGASLRETMQSQVEEACQGNLFESASLIIAQHLPADGGKS